MTVTVDVANVGNYNIDEEVQLYVSPKDISGNLPITSLKAFERITLKKGEKKTVSFVLSPEQLKVINEAGAKVWKKGAYKIIVGNSSPNALSVKLGAAVPMSAEVLLK